MKINDISEEFGKRLSAHLKFYHGSEIPAVLTGDYTLEKDDIYRLTIEKGKFLNTEGTINAYIFKEGEDAIFCIVPKIEIKEFSKYFPQMVPKTPWLTEKDAKLPFPNLPGRKVDNLQWWYIYSTKNVPDTLKKKFYGYDFTGVTRQGEMDLAVDMLSKWDDKPDTESKIKGLFYFGTLPKMPDSSMIPDAAKSVWEFVTENFRVHGCVYRHKLFAHLNLLIPILNPAKKFGGDVVDTLQFSLALTSPLLAVKQIPPINTGDDKKDDDKKDDDKKPDKVEILRAEDKTPLVKQKREVALTGGLVFANGHEITLQGVWPLDEDMFLIGISTELINLRGYLDKSSILADLFIPKNVKLGVKLKFAKKKKKLDAIDFSAEAEDWNLIDGILKFTSVNVDCNIKHPGKVNLTTAKFKAVGILGNDDEVRLLADGSYPRGTYNLSLDPKHELDLAKVINIFKGKNDLGLEATGIVISKLAGQYNSATEHLSLELASNTSAKLMADEEAKDELNFVLNDLSVGIYRAKKDYRFKLNADFVYKISDTEKLNFIGAAEYDKGWTFGAAYNGSVSLGTIARSFKLGDVPKQLDNFTFTKMSFAFDSKEKLKAFEGACKIKLYNKPNVELRLLVSKIKNTSYYEGEFTSTLNDKPATFKIGYLKDGIGFKAALKVAFTVAGVDILLQAVNDTTGEQEDVACKQFAGGTKGLKVPLTKLLDDVLKGAPYQLPAGFLPEIELNDIFVNYNGKDKEVNIIALSTVGKHPVQFFVQYRAANTKEGQEADAKYAFGVSADVADMGSLPLVGEEMKDVSLAGVGFVYVSAEQKYTLPQLEEDEDGGISQLVFGDEVQYKKGMTLTGSITTPDDKPIVLNLERPAQRRLVLGADGVYALAAPADTFEPAVKWLNINKKIGPVAVNKLGFGFDSGRITLLISGAIMLADLSLDVEGLGLSFLLPDLIRGNNVNAKFELNGLGLSLKKEPMELSGMLLRAPNVGKETISFYGGAQISTSSFTIKGIGAYAKMEDKTDSMFVYGLYNGPIGGPAFFFVTGIAAGFGYNRTVRTPTLEQVKEFPLVAMALAPAGEEPSLKVILERLITGQWIPTSPGDYWLALGIKFTSFNIIESFVLVTVKFGGKVEFAVIGLSLLKWPNKGKALVYIELALLAKFGPDSDVIAVTGMLTPNSYLFDPNCKLTGGFAFYSWVSGEHEGDFVITLGGYHPQFKKPDHYPTVDRLALNWKFSDELSLSGEMYFALTPNYLMAGGKWEIAYNLSFLAARVTIWADMFIQWAPFHYEIEAGIIVRIEANIKVLFVRIHFKLQLACIARIWGPPFGGEIYVDWSIFSFTIGFGAGRGEKLPALKWETPKRSDGLLAEGETAGFEETFIPLKDGKRTMIDARLVKGMVNQVPEEAKPGQNAADEITVVSAYDLVLAVDSFMPLNAIETKVAVTAKKGELTAEPQFKALGDDALLEVAGRDIPLTINDRSKNFGIKPMEVTDVKAKLQVWLEKDGVAKTKNVVVIANAKGVTTALWGGENHKGDVIKDAMSGAKLHVVEPPDPQMEKVKLGEKFKDTTANPGLRIYNRMDAGDKATTNIRGRIEKVLKEDNATKVYKSLLNLGFDKLEEPAASLSYDEILTSDPLFIVQTGQMLPSSHM